MTWADVWRAIKAYRPDWFDVCVFVPALVLLVVGYAWYVGDWVWGLIYGVASVLLGLVATQIIGPLWFPRWWFGKRKK